MSKKLWDLDASDRIALEEDLGAGVIPAYRIYRNGSYEFYSDKGGTEVLVGKPDNLYVDLLTDSLWRYDGTARAFIKARNGLPTALVQVEPYFYALEYTDPDDAAGYAYVNETFPAAAGCSAVRIGNLYGRNYDWNYDENVVCLVRLSASAERYASISVCASGLTQASFENRSLSDAQLMHIPYRALDGINEHGVVCSSNVVPSSERDKGWTGTEINGIAILRHVLDHAKSAREGAEMIVRKAFMPSGLDGHSIHYMVADRNETYIVEDGRMTEVSSSSYAPYAILTNFRCQAGDFLTENHVDTVKLEAIDPYGSGVERYDKLRIGTLEVESPDDLQALMRSVYYTNAYRDAEGLPGIPQWPSEFTGMTDPLIPEDVRNLTVRTATAERLRNFYRDSLQPIWEGRTRDGLFWQTVHSSVYDMTGRSVSICVQEGSEKHVFMLDNGTDVRVLARNGSEHAESTGNPHGTTAHDVDSYTQSEIDDKITRFVAHYLTDKVGGRFVPFATHAALAEAKRTHTAENPKFFYAGEGFTPTKNDYCVILDDETVEHKTTRYSFVGEWPSGSWQYQYTINDTAFSQEQWAAINSGVTADKLEELSNADNISYDSKAYPGEGTTSVAEGIDNARSEAGYAITTAQSAEGLANQAATAADGAIGKANEVEANLQSHTNDYNNPHQVSAAQLNDFDSGVQNAMSAQGISSTGINIGGDISGSNLYCSSISDSQGDLRARIEDTYYLADQASAGADAASREAAIANAAAESAVLGLQSKVSFDSDDLDTAEKILAKATAAATGGQMIEVADGEWEYVAVDNGETEAF